MLLQFSFQDATQLLEMLIVQTPVTHQLNTLTENTNTKSVRTETGHQALNCADCFKLKLPWQKSA